ncbi:MAG TPA: dihydroorotate dehydrogenase-like protein [Pyrinomonadaceae bacterium]|nr:dihydroorotate dehydrogenase-like protein [Pyrinomonadaceae bacterium]
MNLATTYLGIGLPNPFVVGSSPLADDLDTVKQLEDAGAAALTLRSLYEEEITGEQMSGLFYGDAHADSSAEAESYFPEPALAPGPDEYLERLRQVKAAVRIPVIASLNGVTTGGWTSCARQIEEAGADAIELNLYNSTGDADTSAAEVESRMIQIVRDVKQHVSIPVAAKLSSRFTAFANFASQLDSAGVDGLVLFTRFHRIDIDVIELEVLRSVELSDSAELELRLKGVAVLAGRVRASLAVTGGVHTGLDVIKATMAGAHVTQLVSAIMANGPRHLITLRRDVEEWLSENEWNSLNEMRGNMSFQRIPDPGAYERATFMRMFK